MGDAYCLLGVIGVMGGDVVSMAVLCEESVEVVEASGFV